MMTSGGDTGDRTDVTQGRLGFNNLSIHIYTLVFDFHDNIQDFHTFYVSLTIRLFCHAKN